MSLLLRLEKPLTEIIRGYDANLPSRLVGQLGWRDFPIGREKDGAPIWPKGLCGSISNIKKKGNFTAVSVSDELRGLGIDIELLSRANSAFRSRSIFLKEPIEVTPLESLLAFSAKESVYKAIFPIIKKKFWFSAVSVTEINQSEVLLKPQSFLNEFGFIDHLRVEYQILDEICFTMLKIS
jgi:4'-phosphopantetheinyl transferase EntD